jgi:hypothetical protein
VLTWVYVVGAVALVGLLILLWVQVPRTMARSPGNSSDQRFEREDKLRVAFSGLVTSVSIGIGAFVTVYQFQATQRAQGDNETSSIYAESVKLLAKGDATPVSSAPGSTA